MKVLSVRNPWAMLIVHGIKPVENREWKRLPSWQPQWLTIHSSQKPEPGSKQFLTEHHIDSEHNGAIVGAAFCSGIHNRKTCPKPIWRSDWINHDCNTFLVFEKAVVIVPVYCKGRLGFWECPPEAEARIKMEVNRCGH